MGEGLNRIMVVEKTWYKAYVLGEELSEEEIKNVSTLLGQPTKRLDVFMDRYRQVMGKYIERRCSNVSGYDICIYVWNRRVPFRAIPVAMHATGTIILFKDDEPIKLLAYPMNKVLSYGKRPGLDPAEYGERVPIEVTRRVDGWHLTAYYDDILNRWVFATKYVLHNMFFERRRLTMEKYGEIVNPFVYVADRLAREDKIYEKLEKFKGWTFNFVLKGPEPAVTRPPYPVGEDYRSYKLYLLLARNPDGGLHTWSSSKKLVGLEAPELVEVKPLRELYSSIKDSFTERSFIAFLGRDGEENPILVELESEWYAEAMNVKYLYDAKSASILLYENKTRELIEIVDNTTIRRKIERLSKLLDDLQVNLSMVEKNKLESVASKIATFISEITGRKGLIMPDEITKNLEKRNIKRIAKKLASIILEGKSLHEDIEDDIKRIIEVIKELNS